MKPVIYLSYIIGLMVVSAGLLPFNLSAQTPEPDVEGILEMINPGFEEDIHREDLEETLNVLYNNPVNINQATRTEMQSIPFLSDFAISRILDFRDIHGPYLSHFELYLVEGLDSVTVDLLVPFIYVDHDMIRHDTLPLVKNIFFTSRKSFMFRYSRILEKEKGYFDHADNANAGNLKFLGSQNYMYGRLEIHELNDFDIGLTFEKDAGEPIVLNPGKGYYGFDHYAGYFRLQNRGLLKEMIMGDFQIHFGEGLVLGRGFIRKGSETVAAVRNRYQGLHPFQGSNEYLFMRGVAAQLGDRAINFTVFASRRGLDGKIESLDENEINMIDNATNYVSAIQTTGYHRSLSEIYSRAKLKEYAAGLQAGYYFPGTDLIIGGVGYFTLLNYPIAKPVRYYNSTPGLKNNYSCSIFYNYIRGKFNLFGEAALSRGKESGFIHGLIANFPNETEMAIHVRHFSPEYYSKYGRSFAEYQGNNNETGIYWGIKTRLLTSIEVRGYIDLFRSSAPRYNIASPSTGFEKFARIHYIPNSNLNISMSWKNELKYRNQPQKIANTYITSRGIKNNLKFQIQVRPNEKMRFQSHLLLNSYKFSETRTIGYTLAQDFLVELKKLRILARIAYFLSDTYNNRLYIYEQDLLYTFQMPVYEGEGIRTYLLLKYSPLQRFNFWLKASMFQYFDREEIGSGLNLIEGNKKIQIKCQVQIKF